MVAHVVRSLPRIFFSLYAVTQIPQLDTIISQISIKIVFKFSNIPFTFSPLRSRFRVTISISALFQNTLAGKLNSYLTRSTQDPSKSGVLLLYKLFNSNKFRKERLELKDKIRKRITQILASVFLVAMVLLSVSGTTIPTRTVTC